MSMEWMKVGLGKVKKGRGGVRGWRKRLMVGWGLAAGEPRPTPGGLPSTNAVPPPT